MPQSSSNSRLSVRLSHWYRVVLPPHDGTLLICGSIAYALVASLTWRWAFYLGAIANGFALTLIIVFYWPPTFIDIHRDGKTRLQQIKELDFVGLLLYGGGLTSFLLGVSWGNNPYPWTSATVLAPLIIGSKIC